MWAFLHVETSAVSKTVGLREPALGLLSLILKRERKQSEPESACDWAEVRQQDMEPRSLSLV